MPLTLHTLRPKPGSHKKSKRLGRGNASGHGTYSGRGIKGQRARSGGRKGLKLLGMKRIIFATPKKRGTKSIHPKPAIINIGDLEKKFKAGDKITPKLLQKSGLIDKISKEVKILGAGETRKNFIIEKCALSAAAKEKIEKAGGTILKS